MRVFLHELDSALCSYMAAKLQDAGHEVVGSVRCSSRVPFMNTEILEKNSLLSEFVITPVVLASDRSDLRFLLRVSDVVYYNLESNPEESLEALRILEEEDSKDDTIQQKKRIRKIEMEEEDTSEEKESVDDQLVSKSAVIVGISTVLTWIRTQSPTEEGFMETDYKLRKPSRSYAEIKAVEVQLLNSNKRPRNKTSREITAVIVTAGLVYGGDDSNLLYLFREAWLHSPHPIPLPTTVPMDHECYGKNSIPMISLYDLSAFLLTFMDSSPSGPLAKLSRENSSFYFLALDNSRYNLTELTEGIIQMFSGTYKYMTNKTRGWKDLEEQNQVFLEEEGKGNLGTKSLMKLQANIKFQQNENGRLKRYLHDTSKEYFETKDFENPFLSEGTETKDNDDGAADESNPSGDDGNSNGDGDDDELDLSKDEKEMRRKKREMTSVKYMNGLLSSSRFFKDEFLKSFCALPIRCIILGAPKIGKTTLARKLSREYFLPLISPMRALLYFTQTMKSMEKRSMIPHTGSSSSMFETVEQRMIAKRMQQWKQLSSELDPYKELIPPKALDVLEDQNGPAENVDFLNPSFTTLTSLAEQRSQDSRQAFGWAQQGLIENSLDDIPRNLMNQLLRWVLTQPPVLNQGYVMEGCFMDKSDAMQVFDTVHSLEFDSKTTDIESSETDGKEDSSAAFQEEKLHDIAEDMKTKGLFRHSLEAFAFPTHVVVLQMPDSESDSKMAEYGRSVLRERCLSLTEEEMVASKNSAEQFQAKMEAYEQEEEALIRFFETSKKLKLKQDSISRDENEDAKQEGGEEDSTMNSTLSSEEERGSIRMGLEVLEWPVMFYQKKDFKKDDEDENDDDDDEEQLDIRTSSDITNSDESKLTLRNRLCKRLREKEMEEYKKLYDAIKRYIGNATNFRPTWKEKQLMQKEEEVRIARDLEEQQDKEREAERMEKSKKNTQLQKEQARKRMIECEEKELLEARSLPLRQYLMKTVIPTLTEGMLKILKQQPEDPIDALAEFLFEKGQEKELEEKKSGET